MFDRTGQMQFAK